MYKLFFNDPGFEKFVVRDILNRSTKLIEAIRADSDLDLDDLTVSNMTEKVKTEDLSDPFALSFLMQQLMQMGKIDYKSHSSILVKLYEIFFSFAILFGADQKAKAGELMLQNSLEIMSEASLHLADIEHDEAVLEQLINNHLMKWMCSGLNFDTTFKVNKCKGKLLSI